MRCRMVRFEWDLFCQQLPTPNGKMRRLLLDNGVDIVGCFQTGGIYLRDAQALHAVEPLVGGVGRVVARRNAKLNGGR